MPTPMHFLEHQCVVRLTSLVRRLLSYVIPHPSQHNFIEVILTLPFFACLDVTVIIIRCT